MPFGDAAELVAAAACLGVAHPPGYPVWILLAHGALAVPLGEPAFRVALLSAAFAALACMVVAAWVRRVTGSPPAGLAAGLALAAGATFWGVATTAEVYALHLLLVVLLLGGAWVTGVSASTARRSWAVFACGAVLGLGLAHHPTIVLTLPSAAILAWPSRRSIGSRTWAVAAALALAIPALSYLSLMARARLDPPSNWGEPTSFAALVTHATAAQYRANDLGIAGLTRPEGWLHVASWAWSDGAGVVLIAALAGAAFGRRRNGRIVAALALLVAGATAFALRYAVEDVDAYLLPAALGFAVFTGLAVAAAEARLRRWAWAACAAVALVPLVANLETLDRRTFTAAEAYGRDMLLTVPEHGILVVEGDDGFLPRYLQQVAGERPDVLLVDADGHLGPRVGDLASFVRETSQRGAPRVLLFTNPPEFPLPDGFELRPWGLFLRLARAADPPLDDAALWSAYRGESIRAQAEAKEDLWGRTVGAWYPIALARRAVANGDADEARRRLDEAVRIASDSEATRNMVGAMAAELGDLPRAAVEFEAAVRLKPSSWRGWANLAQARSMMGDRAGAARALQEARRLERR